MIMVYICDSLCIFLGDVIDLNQLTWNIGLPWQKRLRAYNLHKAHVYTTILSTKIVAETCLIYQICSICCAYIEKVRPNFPMFLIHL